MTKYLIGMVGVLAGMLIGGRLMLALFALVYQPSGADWADPTYIDFRSGLAILVISLIGLIMCAVGLAGELKRRGIIKRREVPEAQQVQAAGIANGWRNSGWFRRDRADPAALGDDHAKGHARPTAAGGERRRFSDQQSCRAIA